MTGERCICFFKQCRTKYKNEKITYFRPGETFDVWQKMLPRLTRTSRLCARHFDEADIRKGIVILDVFHPFKRWRLRKGAVPKYHLGVVHQTRETNSRNTGSTEVTNPRVLPAPRAPVTATNKDHGTENSTLDNRHEEVQVIEISGNQSPEVRVCNGNATKEAKPNENAQCPQPKKSNESFTNQLTPQTIPVTPICGLDHTYVMTSSCTVSADRSNEMEVICEVSMDRVPELPQNEDVSVVSNGLGDHEAPTDESKNFSQMSDNDVIMEELAEDSVETAPVSDDNRKPAVQLTSAGLTKKFIEELQKMPLPSKDWFWLLNKAQKQASCSVYVTLKDQILIKTIIVTSPTTVTFLANGKPVKLANLKTTFTDHGDLHKIICKFDTAKLCDGIKGLQKTELSSSIKAFKEKDGTIRSNSCTVLACPSNECRNCKEILFYLKKKAQRPVSEAARKPPNVKALRRKIARYSAKLEKSKNLIAKMKAELSEAKAELRTNSVASLMQELNPMEKTILKLFLMRTSLSDKDAHGRGNRYEESVLRHCTLLWLKNPSTYNFLKKNNIIPLPSQTTVSHYLKTKKDRLENFVGSDYLRKLIGLNPKETETENVQELETPTELETRTDVNHQESENSDIYVYLEL